MHERTVHSSSPPSMSHSSSPPSLSHSSSPPSLLQEMSKLRSENEGLKQLRKQMDNEIEELTAALFQEAYKMVNGAHARRVGVEKQLQETQGKVML